MKTDSSLVAPKRPILAPWRARLVLVGLLALVLSGLQTTDIVQPPRSESEAIGDAKLGLRIIQRLATGEAYYTVYGDELRRHQYPTRSFLNWRTPLHYELVARLSLRGAGALLAALALAVVAAGTLAYGKQSTLKSVTAPLLLFGAMLPALLVRPDGLALPEIWAGALIALSLAAYVLERCVLAAVLGVIAVFLRELAVPYALACGLLALHARRRHESMVWVTGGLAFLVYYAFHTVQVAAATQADDLAHSQSWIQWAGLPFVLKTLHTYGWLTIVPPAWTAVAAGAGLLSVFAVSAPVQVRVSLIVYLLLFSIVGQPFNYYWGYLTAGVWAHAFVFCAEGTHSVLRAAFSSGNTSQRNRVEQ
jgi:hypothetical protein